MTSVQLTAGAKVEGAALFVGDSGSDNGLGNPSCATVGASCRRRAARAAAAGPASQRRSSLTSLIPLPAPFPPTASPPSPKPQPTTQNIDLPANQAVEVQCELMGKYVTLATPGNLTLCDIYINGWQARGPCPLAPLPVLIVPSVFLFNACPFISLE